MNQIVKIKEVKSIEEIIEGYRKSYPLLLYKYRRWDDENHKSYLTIPSIWYGHPKTFNDEQDIRVPYEVNYDEVYDDRFPGRFEQFFQTRISPGSRDYQIILENTIDIIRQDPKKWFEKNAQDLRNGGLYDNVGVFSLSKNPLSPQMWGYYGNDNKGFCIGYSPVRIFLSHTCALYRVKYSETGIQYSLLEPRDQWNFEEFYLKSKKWEHEEEYRFIAHVDKQEERLKIIPPLAIANVTLGCNIAEKDTSEIIDILKKQYHSKVELYKARIKYSGFGLERFLVHY